MEDKDKAAERFQEEIRLKDALIEEMGHRFRNQLQIITSLLDIQASRTQSAEVADALKQCRVRIGSIAAVHEMLRPGQSAGKIDMAGYLKNLTAAVMAAWRGEQSDVELHVEAEEIKLAAPRAAIVGLVVTELVTNSLKHAFGPEQKGKIVVELKRKGQELALVVKDNGKGLDLKDWREPKGGGLRLTRSLVGQLKGTLECGNQDGAEVIILFPA